MSSAVIEGTRDVYYVMSATLSFVNHMSHIVETCIRRNFKSYPITLHNIVFSSSALCWFDLIKNVMLSTVPEKKRIKIIVIVIIIIINTFVKR